MYPHSHFVNAFINTSSKPEAEQSLQQKSNKQPPKKSFIGRNANTNNAEKDISRLFAILLFQWIPQETAMFALLQKNASLYKHR